MPCMASLVDLPASFPCCVASRAASNCLSEFWLSIATSSIDADSSVMAAAIFSALLLCESALFAISSVVADICSADADSWVEPLATPSTLCVTPAKRRLTFSIICPSISAISPSSSLASALDTTVKSPFATRPMLSDTLCKWDLIKFAI